jgi:hypothetical protein
MRFDIVTQASPDQVRQALTDFTEQRLKTWSRTLDPKTYELREHGETWALARESSPGSPFWVVCRYDWADPAVIRWAVEDSSYGGGGQGFAVITAASDGGSRLHVQWDSTGARPLQKPLLFVLHSGLLDRFIARLWTSALDRYAQAHAADAANGPPMNYRGSR